ncbi:UDP-N-acetylmuramoyl-L-alanyl-D-glutamate--2,6-diaminopimelate ligase [Alkalibacillus filiformis]|uniref:UDP-N-acetylmuramoyl-L-alanyl-D-glutamate--2, 6-diaminopimelate ligase n=1 Tax=Alkalibacillus filiformis TaxID=200990 RepID=A0ABU0DS50_9BACI|nr:UDP-N-acetylmuramoyl-L-alanyl-D-glutamate--2,6-diaminopimelate ligase [Alkalibacillus filiformis]MDQ0351272.1 UDP-N-acetylmuramoyl-L-alanyl-D-glutamate--2,6-diaminopimelate ligase [Alkalibacillus filiformis]
MVEAKKMLSQMEYKHISQTVDHINVVNIVDDSRKVKEGSLFVAVKGYAIDGHEFIEEAVNKGAVAVVGEEDNDHLSVPYIKVENSRKALGELAKQFYEDPLKGKIVIGVTGTNGKTTTSHLIHYLLDQSNINTSLIGTASCIINSTVYENAQTTPSVLDLYKHFYNSKDDVIVIEVSSHGLAQHRLAGVEFDYAVFTNLTYEHLDYHESMEDYYQVKKQLFNQLKSQGQAVVNVDNEWGARLCRELNADGLNCVGVGKQLSSNVVMKELVSVGKPSVTVHYKHKSYKLNWQMLGIHNLYNLALAYTTVNLIVKSPIQLKEVVAKFPGVPGRFEQSKLPTGSKVVVDYAHTPDAVKEVLLTINEAKPNKLIHVLAFKANRDESKRKDMIKYSLEQSDLTILTTGDLDHLTENEMDQELRKYQTEFGSDQIKVSTKRVSAIKEAVLKAEEGDWVVITGQGQKSYQQSNELNTKTDQETINYLKKLLSVEQPY